MPEEEKTILISGCSSGIGYHVARGLRDRGYRVFAGARDPDDVARLCDEGLEGLALDLADPASVDAAVVAVLEATGGSLYALFNNGAYGQPGAVEDLRREVLEAQFDANLFGAHQLVTRVLPVMRRQGHGRIIQHSSVLGLACLGYRGAYNATKYALEALSDTLRLELRDTDIHVSLINPGPIRSRFRPNAISAYFRNIDRDASAHRARYEAMEARLRKKGPAVPFTLGPEAVLEKVIHALESRRPKTRYYVTVPTYALAFLKRVLTDRAMDRVLHRLTD